MESVNLTDKAQDLENQIDQYETPTIGKANWVGKLISFGKKVPFLNKKILPMEEYLLKKAKVKGFIRCMESYRDFVQLEIDQRVGNFLASQSDKQKEGEEDVALRKLYTLAEQASQIWNNHLTAKDKEKLEPELEALKESFKHWIEDQGPGGDIMFGYGVFEGLFSNRR